VGPEDGLGISPTRSPGWYGMQLSVPPRQSVSAVQMRVPEMGTLHAAGASEDSQRIPNRRMKLQLNHTGLDP
jgi:hypothetical protein